MKLNLIVLALAISFALLSAIFIFSFVEVYKNMGMVRAFCPNDYCSPIPQGLSGISFGVKYPDATEDEKMVILCNSLYPLNCNYLD